MSEVFDPEKVFRYTAHNFRLRADGDTQAGMVAQEDYDKLQALSAVGRHLLKRMYDECGSTKAEEFIRRVKAKEHDVPSPWTP